MRLAGVGPRPDSLNWAGLWSASLHAALLLALVWRPQLSRLPQPAPASVEVELVRQPDTKQGAPPQPVAQPTPTPAPAPAPPNPPPTPQASPATAVPAAAPSPSPPPTADQASLPPPAPSPPTADPDVPLPTQPTPTPAPPAPQAAQAAEQPVVNLGNSDVDREAYSVTGANVVSEGPDARYHNLPPRYPRDAARARLHGTVALRIHIDPAGDPGEIEVVESSGVPSMDQSALTAVARWRFKPAIRDGAPVGSIYLIEFNFVDNER